MSTYYRTQGIILAKQEVGEADRFLTAYTEDFGMLRLLAIGVRKITSKLRSGLELFDLSNIEFVEGKNTGILTDAILKNGFWSIRKNLARIQAAKAVSDRMKKFFTQPEKDEKVWELLRTTFELLNNKNADLKKAYSNFCIQLTSFLGYTPFQVSGR